MTNRHQQFNIANEHRHEFDLVMTKLTEWIKTAEQQIKDPFTNDLQQAANVLKEKSKSVQVRIHLSFDNFYFAYL